MTLSNMKRFLHSLLIPLALLGYVLAGLCIIGILPPDPPSPQTRTTMCPVTGEPLPLGGSDIDPTYIKPNNVDIE